MRRDATGVRFVYACSRALTKLPSLVPLARRNRGATLVVVEAGEAGWAEPAPGLIEIEESAVEYLGENSVRRFSVRRHSKSYLLDVFRVLKRHRPSHYFYDSRTGSQNPFWGSVQAVAIAVYLAFFDVVPITILTNFPARRWRRQVSGVTARRGLVLLLIPPSAARGKLPHDRLLGPIFMPFSKKRMAEIRGVPKPVTALGNANLTFIGSVYEPRKSVIEDVKHEFDKNGLNFLVYARDAASPKIDRETYWDVLRQSPFLFTTADHIVKAGADVGCPPHMVYRYTEALIAESCLVAPDLGSALVAFEHFIPFTDAETLRETMAEFLEQPEKAESIRRRGAEFIQSRVDNQRWWREIDEALGEDRLRKW